MTLANPTPDREDADRQNSGRKENFWVQAAATANWHLSSPPLSSWDGWSARRLDRWLHTTWLYLAGILLGIAAGFFELIRTVLRDTK